MKRPFNYNRNKIIFYGLMGITIVFALIWCYIDKGYPLSNILFSDKNDTFMDFYNSLYHAGTGHPYDIKCIYPPFTYLIYSVFLYFIPENIFTMGSLEIRENQMGMLIFVIYMIITLGIMSYLVHSNKSGKKVEKIFFLFMILFSTPFLYTIERGNIVIVTLIFLLIFAFNYDSNNKIYREIAIIALAMAASTKIYPAIFGLILLKEKRYKEAFRCAIYGLMIFFLPFLIFGGFEKAPLMFNNIFNAVEDFMQTGLGYKVNISNTIKAFGRAIGLETEGYISFANISSYIVLIISLITSLFIKEKWKVFCMLATLLVAFPNFSYTYTLIFMVIPLIMFLDKNGEPKKIDIFYALCFVGIFFPCVLNIPELFSPKGEIGMYYTLGTCIESISIVAILFVLNIEGITSILKRRKKNGRH